MKFFGKDNEEDFEEFEESPRQIKNLKPKKEKPKEPPKPWGKKERYIVLSAFLGTILISSFLAVFARGFKLPGLPKLDLTLKPINLFGEEVITLGNKDQTEVEKKGRIINKFKETTNNLSGVYALYVIDLTANNSFGVNENDIMQAASLIKLPVMLYVDGKVGDEKVEAMGKRSDNVVFNEMLNKFGRDNLQNYVSTLGMPNTSIEENTTTPKEIGDLFKKIYMEGNKKILNSLTNTSFEDWLVKGVPENIKVSHKFGREVHVVNDAGIVFTDKPYVVVIMTESIIENEANSIFPELSKLVYDEFK